MPKFEVFIPAADEQSFNVTFRVDAANWMAALKTGMQKLGEQGATTRNVLVDVQEDNSVHVTEPVSGRVFQIREMTDAESAAAQVKKPAAASPPPPPPPRPAEAVKPDVHTAKTQPGMPAATPEPIPLQNPVEPKTSPELAAAVSLASATAASPPKLSGGIGISTTAETSPMRAVEAPSRTPEPLVAPPPIALKEEKIVELERPTRPPTGRIGRAKATTAERDALEDMLEDVFERVADLLRETDAQKAMYFLLDLALEKIPAESGSVLRADTTSGDLTFLAARGPKAKELLEAKLVVPHGQGIVGFCSMEGVSVALSDVQKDPRFYPAVSERLKYENKSVLTAPMMTHGRAFGCFQILNKKDDKPFTAPELGVLSYLAHQGALYLNERA